MNRRELERWMVLNIQYLVLNMLHHIPPAKNTTTSSTSLSQTV